MIMSPAMRTLSTFLLITLFTLNAFGMDKRISFRSRACLPIAGQVPLLNRSFTGIFADEPPRKGIENAAALQNFFRALADTRSGQRLEPVRIMHFGDSHTAADVLTADIRRHFQGDFGDGGAGWIVPKNPMSTRRLGVTSGAT